MIDIRAQITPEQILRSKLSYACFLSTKDHSLQEFKRLAKQAKANETQIIVKKLKPLCSSSNKPEAIERDPATTLQELGAQLTALEVCFAHLEENPIFSPTYRPLGNHRERPPTMTTTYEHYTLSPILIRTTRL